MHSKIPEKITSILNIHKYQHAKIQVIWSSYSMVTKINMLDMNGVTQIVTALFKKSYLMNQQ
jgi:hypothetical protein